MDQSYMTSQVSNITRKTCLFASSFFYWFLISINRRKYIVVIHELCIMLSIYIVVIHELCIMLSIWSFFFRDKHTKSLLCLEFNLKLRLQSLSLIFLGKKVWPGGCYNNLRNFIVKNDIMWIGVDLKGL